MMEFDRQHYLLGGLHSSLTARRIIVKPKLPRFRFPLPWFHRLWFDSKTFLLRNSYADDFPGNSSSYIFPVYSLFVSEDFIKFALRVIFFHNIIPKVVIFAGKVYGKIQCICALKLPGKKMTEFDGHFLGNALY